MSNKIIKKQTRCDIKAKLQQIPPETIELATKSILNQLFNFPVYLQCHGVSVYLSMMKEVQTTEIIKNSLENCKRLYIPKITGPNSDDMFMFPIESWTQINDLPKNNWGIPEPSLESIKEVQDGTYSSAIDLVIVPGVAFDSNCNRLGHGKGYYDCFLDRISKYNLSNNVSVPITVGLALDEQILDMVPVDEHDKKLDYIITPTKILCGSQP